MVAARKGAEVRKMDAVHETVIDGPMAIDVQRGIVLPKADDRKDNRLAMVEVVLKEIVRVMASVGQKQIARAMASVGPIRVQKVDRRAAKKRESLAGNTSSKTNRMKRFGLNVISDTARRSATNVGPSCLRSAWRYAHASRD